MKNLFTVCLLLFIIITTGQSQNAPITTAGSVSVCPNVIFNVPITVTSINNIGAITLRLDYDSTLLHYNGYSNSNAAFLGGITAGSSPDSAYRKKIMIVWSSTSVVNLTNGSKLLDLNFTLLSGSPTLQFNNTLGFCEYADTSVIGSNGLNDLPSSTYYINSTITNSAPGTPGTISGASAVCKGQSNVTYTVPAITNATSYTWSYSGTGATITGNSASVSISFASNATSGNLTVKGSNTCLTPGVISSNFPITVNSLPDAAGIISGTSVVCQGQNNVTYTVPAITNATSYTWVYSGSGATITGNSASVSISFASNATSGNLTVQGSNINCGTGVISANYPVTVNLLPAAAGTITGPATVCQGQTNVTYTVPVIANATSYIWAYSGTGATITGTSANVSISFSTTATSGNLTIKGSNSSCFGEISAIYPVTVNLLPVAAGTITGLATACQGQSNVTYTVPAITNATSYIWAYSGTGATITGTSASVSISFSSTATFGNLTVQGSNSNCFGVISANYPVTLNPLPVAAGTISGTSVVCQGQNNVPYSVPIISNATSYTWSYSGSGATITGTTNNAGISFSTNATSGILTVKGTNSCGDGIISANYPVTVNPIPVAAGTISGPATVCQGQNNLTYTVPVITNANSYTWTYSGTGATITGNTNSVSISFSSTATSGNLTVKGINSCGEGIISANYPVIVNPLPVAAGTITGPATVCQGQINVTYNVPVIANATSYIWTLPLGSTGTNSGNSINLNYGTTAVSGNITVRGNNACGEGIFSANYPVTINPLPDAAGTINGQATLCQGVNNVTYTVPAIANATSYVWTLPSGSTGTSSTNSINVNYGLSAVSGNITVKGLNTCGEGLSASLPVTVNPIPGVAGSISGLTSVYQGQTSVNYSVPVINNATSYNWSLPDGATGIISNNSINIDFSASAISGNVTVSGYNSCGSGTSSSLSINVNCTSPSIQATLLNASLVKNTSMKLEWIRGNGNAVIIIARHGNAVNSEPVNGNSYIADTAFGMGSQTGPGNYVVYNGTGTSVNLVSLTPESNYFFAVYEYNTLGNCYNTSGLYGSVITSAVNSTFTGTNSTSWENSTNWNHGIPSSETNATIPANKLAIVNSNNYQCNNLTIAPQGKLTINSGKDIAINGVLTVQSDASGTGSLIHNNTLSGNIERYIPITNAEEYHMLASPVISQNINTGFSPVNQSFFAWNESNGSWVPFEDTGFNTLNGSNVFTPGRGYVVSYSTASTKIFTGVLNNGTITTNLMFTAGNYSGWNLVANPYPSSINWEAANGWTRGLLEDAGGGENALWIWNPETGNYGTYITNGGIGSGTNGVTSSISISQGFWVKATSTGIFSMTNDVREHSIQPFLKSSSIVTEMLRLSVTSTANAFSDEIIIRFGNVSNLGGAEKMFSLETSAPNLYSTKLNKKWSINNLTDIAANSTIPVGFKSGADGNYNLSVSGTEAFGNVILEDIKTGVQHNFSVNNNYSFYSQITDSVNRFLLHFNPVNINNIDHNVPMLYYSNHFLHVFNPWMGKTILSIYDINGKFIQNHEVKEGNTNYNFRSIQGVYILKLINGDKIIVKKIIIY